MHALRLDAKTLPPGTLPYDDRNINSEKSTRRLVASSTITSTNDTMIHRGREYRDYRDIVRKRPGRPAYSRFTGAYRQHSKWTTSALNVTEPLHSSLMNLQLLQRLYQRKIEREAVVRHYRRYSSVLSLF
jgi:hypothetical protein